LDGIEMERDVKAIRTILARIPILVMTSLISSDLIVELD